jgi:hypothetical protein
MPRRRMIRWPFALSHPRYRPAGLPHALCRRTLRPGDAPPAPRRAALELSLPLRNPGLGRSRALLTSRLLTGSFWDYWRKFLGHVVHRGQPSLSERLHSWDFTPSSYSRSIDSSTPRAEEENRALMAYFHRPYEGQALECRLVSVRVHLSQDPLGPSCHGSVHPANHWIWGAERQCQ